MHVLKAAAVFLFSLLWGAADGGAAQDNRLYRIGVTPRAGFTRLKLSLDREPMFHVTQLPGNRVRVTLRGTDGGRWKKLRSYSDKAIDGITVGRRQSDLLVTVGVKGDPRGVRALTSAGSGVLTLDIGPGFAPPRTVPFTQGREGIRGGVEQLVTRFDPPLKSDIPFVPTDRRSLEKILPPPDVEQLLAGEAALYRGKGSEAEELLSPLAAKDTPAKGLALFRRGEARATLQKYGEALKDFREAERLWPEFLNLSPGTTFVYADSIVRSGDLEGGRRLLGRLIAGLADKKYAPVLLVRLADILARQGKEMEAVAIYRTVSENFAGNKAVWQARMKLVDRRLMAVEPSTFGGLVAEYREIFDRGGDNVLREEALFKAALLTALFGDADAGFALVVEYGKRFPQGIYGSIVRGMREELLVPVVQRLVKAGDHEGLTKLAKDNKEYLVKCLADPGFVRGLSEAFAAREAFKEEATLFSFLVEREWSAPQAPELYRRLVADAERLGDLALLEKSAGDFLGKFPDHPSALRYREQLAGLAYHRGDMATVIARLAPLLAGKARPEEAESLYYLGKALDGAGNRRDAEKAMILFVSELRQRSATSELAPDAYYVAASARLARGDRKGAMELLRAGSATAPETQREPFLYKMGEIARAEGRRDEAASHFKAVATTGRDPLWQKMAAQALADIELTRRLAGKVPLSK
ncbi:MAG: hypothetical protein ED859_05565 [Desulfuromonadales bacterium]|nr:MAG: hypothetical protein ED859_05565 [Desulfuromonadales bacterium]